MTDHIGDMPEGRKQRVGQRVQICYQPLMIAEVTSWDEQRQLWQATVIVPKLGTPMEFREDFLQYLVAEEN